MVKHSRDVFLAWVASRNSNTVVVVKESFLFLKPVKNYLLGTCPLSLLFKRQTRFLVVPDLNP